MKSVTYPQSWISTEYTQIFKYKELMMISMQYLKSRFFWFELQMLFTCNDGNFGKSGRLVQVAEIAPELLMIECTTAMAMAFWSIERAGIPFSVLWFSFGSYPPEYDPDTINNAINTGSSIYFVNLVIMQFFNLMCARTRRLSILQQPPIIRNTTRNYYLFPAMGFALGVGKCPIDAFVC